MMANIMKIGKMSMYTKISNIQPTDMIQTHCAFLIKININNFSYNMV